MEVTKSQQRVIDFLKTHSSGVLATVDKASQPHAAAVYITTDSEMNFYFVTKRDTQKSRNLQQNPRAAIAIFDESTQTTVQVQGQAIEVTNQEKASEVITDIWSIALRTSRSHLPPTSKIAGTSYVVYMFSAPIVRMASFSQSDPGEYHDIFESVNIGSDK